jgi:carbon storage regulator
MLYLTRKPGEAVLINQDIEVRVIEVRGRTVKLGFTYPQGATVLREEIAGPLRDANREAAEALRDLPRPAKEDL